MRKVVVYSLVSVDGVAEAPENFVFAFDDAMSDHLGEVIRSQDDVLLGRVMYEEWSRYWPTSDDQPFADFINSVDKHVATSSALIGSWTNAAAIEGSVLDYVRSLRAGEGGDVGVHGSLTLTQSLLSAGLVDEVHLVVAPCVVGAGRRLFESAEALQRLELVSSVGTPSGSLLAHYRVADAD